MLMATLSRSSPRKPKVLWKASPVVKKIPLFLPILGSLVCAGLVIVRVTTGDWRAPALAGALLAGIFLIYAVLRPKAGMPQGLG